MYGESKREHKRNVHGRNFRLGAAKVEERTTYDHVGIRAAIFSDYSTGVEERLSKAKRTLNMLTGLGDVQPNVLDYCCPCSPIWFGNMVIK